MISIPALFSNQLIFRGTAVSGPSGCGSPLLAAFLLAGRAGKGRQKQITGRCASVPDH